MNRSETSKKKNDWLFILPAIFVVAVMTQIPFLLTVVYSTLRWNLARPDIPIVFSGIDNYLFFLKISDFTAVPEFYSIVLQTITVTVVALMICTVIGFLFSILLDHPIPGVNIARTLIMGPFFVMSTVTGVIWKTRCVSCGPMWTRGARNSSASVPSFPAGDEKVRASWLRIISK